MSEKVEKWIPLCPECPRKPELLTLFSPSECNPPQGSAGLDSKALEALQRIASAGLGWTGSGPVQHRFMRPASGDGDD